LYTIRLRQPPSNRFSGSLPDRAGHELEGYGEHQGHQCQDERQVRESHAEVNEKPASGKEIFLVEHVEIGGDPIRVELEAKRQVAEQVQQKGSEPGVAGPFAGNGTKFLD